MAHLPVLSSPTGNGFALKNFDTYVTANEAVALGDCVQLSMSSDGIFTSCYLAGQDNAASTGASFANTLKRITKVGAFASVPGNTNTITALSGAQWTESSKTITKSAAFTNYTFTSASNDKVVITGGTNATVGIYTVAGKTSADAITLTASIGALADTQVDIAGNLGNGSASGLARIKVTGGTGATTGFYQVYIKISDDAISLDRTIGAGADGQSNIAFTLLDPKLEHGVFGIALEDASSGGQVKVRLHGVCKAFTRNTADAAIASMNLYAPVADGTLDSDAATYGINAKFVARAVGTALVSTTATRALRLVQFNGISGYGNYAGAN